MAKDSGKDSHSDESGERGGEDNESGMFHGHESSDKECFIPYFREDDHGEGQDEGMEGLDNRGGSSGGEHRNGVCVGFKNREWIALGDCGRDRRRNIVWLLWEVGRFLVSHSAKMNVFIVLVLNILPAHRVPSSCRLSCHPLSFCHHPDFLHLCPSCLRL